MLFLRRKTLLIKFTKNLQSYPPSLMKTHLKYRYELKNQVK